MPPHGDEEDGDGGNDDESDTTPRPTPTEIDGDAETADLDNEEIRSILIELPDAEFSKLSSMKNKYGFTWKGMLFRAYRSLRREHDCEKEC